MPVISNGDPEVLTTLNVVPADPFPPATGVIRLFETPVHPDAPN